MFLVDYSYIFLSQVSMYLIILLLSVKYVYRMVESRSTSGLVTPHVTN